MSVIVIVIMSLLLAFIIITRFFLHATFKTVITGSMEPELPVGSLLMITPAEYDEISIGDDITFVRDESLTLVTHRVVGKNDKRMTITTKGIANNTKDAPTSYDNVVGKVRLCIPFIGYIGLWLSTPKGIIITVTAVLSVIIICLLIKYIFFAKPSQQKEKDDEYPAEQSSDDKAGE